MIAGRAPIPFPEKAAVAVWLESNQLRTTIEKRRKSDDEMFQGAFSDLLSIVGINTPKAHHQARGAVAMILKYLGKDIPTIPDGVETLDAQLDYM